MHVISDLSSKMRVILVPASMVLFYISTASGQVQCTDGHGIKGKCISLKQCPKISELLQTGFLYDEDREFLQESKCTDGVGPTPHVCCASQSEAKMPQLTMSSFYTNKISRLSVNSLTADTKTIPNNMKPSPLKFPSPSYNTINTKPIVEDNNYDDYIDFAQRVEVYQSDDDIDFAVRIPVGPEKPSVSHDKVTTSVETPSRTESLPEMDTTQRTNFDNTGPGSSTESPLYVVDTATLTSLETSELILQTVETTTLALDSLNVTTSSMETDITSQVSEMTIEATPQIPSTSTPQEDLIADRCGEEVPNTTTTFSPNITDPGDSMSSSNTGFSDATPTQPASTATTSSPTTVAVMTDPSQNLIGEQSAEEVPNTTTTSSPSLNEPMDSTALSSIDFSDISPSKPASTAITSSPTAVADMTNASQNLLGEQSAEPMNEPIDSTTLSSSDFSDISPTEPASTAITSSPTDAAHSNQSTLAVSENTYPVENTSSTIALSDPTESVSLGETKFGSLSTTPISISSLSIVTTPIDDSTTASVPENITNYANNEFPMPPDCGSHGVTQRIFGGGITDLDEYPWVVLLEYGKSEITSVRCGGVLINFRYVLTAAHCVTPLELKRQGGLKAVRIGEYDTKTDPDCIDGDCLPRVLIAGVEETIVHEKFHPMQRTDDIALLRLNKTIGKGRCSVPICMPSSARFAGSPPGVEVVVAGWGKTENESFSNIKRKVDLLIFNHLECRKFYAAQGQNIIISHVCAGGKENKDSCGGDSGGPLMRLYQGSWVVEGIVSYGAKKCGTKGWPGVYTRVLYYESWIRFKMKP